MQSKKRRKGGTGYYTAVVTTITALLFTPIIANAQDTVKPAAALADCDALDTACLLPQLDRLSAKIDNTSWRDQTLRELAKLYAARGMDAEALALLPRITSPDTRALTIRGIGMEAARRNNATPDQRTALFTALRADADGMAHKPSQGIALTYIAMAQAFAGDDAGAHQTARAMENPALRHKAFAETAEIQAERGDVAVALHSLTAIEDPGFRNKAHATVARVFVDRKDFKNALTLCERIENDYMKSQTLLYILAKQITPDEVSLGIKE